MRIVPLAVLLCLSPWLFACNDLEPLPPPPDPASLDAVERARFQLGHALFFDPGLSSTGDVSCATCHDPARAGTDELARSIGVEGTEVRRNAPSVFNAALKARQFWDGRSLTLEEQALGPLLSPDEMGQTEEGVLDHVRDQWAEEFAAAFPGEDGPTLDQVARALAAYERMLPSPSRYDRFLEGDRDALDRSERRGLRLFRRNCAFCHGGVGVGGQGLELLGEEEPWPADRRDDQGRFEVTSDPDDRMWFMVPSLRNVAQTGPWFHDGSVDTLEEAVRLMARHQLGRTFRPDQVQDLVAFLESLDAEQVPPWAYADWSGTAL